MDFKELPKFAMAFVIIGLVVGIGVLLFDQMSTGTYVDRTVANESFLWPQNGSTVALAHGNLTGLTDIHNSTGSTYLAGNYSVNLVTGVVTALSNSSGIASGATVYALYVWRDTGSEANIALYAVRDAIGTLATSWLGLIVLVGCLSIILVLVIKSFRNKGLGRS